MRNIEILWSDGKKTVESYEPDVCLNDTLNAEKVFSMFVTLGRLSDVKPISYKEV